MVTFTVAPGFELTVEETARQVTSSPALGMVNHGVLEDQTVRVWQLRWDTLTDAEASTIRGYYDSAAGGALSMDWTPPGAASAVKVRFLGPPRLRRISGSTWSGDLALEEAHGL